MSAPRRPRIPSPLASPPAEQRQGERPTVRPEPPSPENTHVIGWLVGDSVGILLDAVEGGISALELWALEQVDDPAARVLARLWPERRTLLACPRWRELWLAGARANGRNPGRREDH